VDRFYHARHFSRRRLACLVASPATRNLGDFAAGKAFKEDKPRNSRLVSMR
jgi:hypothetical protein